MGHRSLDVDVGFVDRFEELHRVAYRDAFAVLGRRPDAQDCAQEALARALVGWRTIADYAPAWVARVSTNLAIDRTRRESRASTFVEGGDMSLTAPLSSATWTDDAEFSLAGWDSNAIYVLDETNDSLLFFDPAS